MNTLILFFICCTAALTHLACGQTELTPDIPVHGETTSRNQFVSYVLKFSNGTRSENASVLFEIDASRGNPQIFVSATKQPTNVDYTWNSISIGPEKFLLVSSTDPLLPEGTSTLHVSIMCFIIDTCHYDLTATVLENSAPPEMVPNEKSVIESWFSSCCGDVCMKGRTACDWLGLMCDAAGHVTTLQLHNRMNLANCKLPTNIGELTSLRRLDLNGNTITGEIPSSLAQLSRLEFLDLSFNFLGGSSLPSLTTLTSIRIFQIKQNLFSFPASDLAFLGGCPNLTSIYITTNKIFGQLPPEHGNCQKMVHYFVSSNKLGGIIPHSFGNWTKLEILSISRNSVGGVIPSSLGKWERVSDVYFYGNSFTSIEFPIPLWTQLRLAYFHSCQLQGTLAGDWTALKWLWNLRLEKNSLTGSIPESMCGLTSLKTLNLNVNKLTGSVPACLGTNLTALTTLNLGGNQFTGPLPMVSSTSLATLSLESNNFQGGLPESYKALKSVQSLDLSDNQLNFSMAEALTILGPLAKLGALQMSHNQIHGPIWVDASPFIFYNIFRGLTDLSVSHNRLTKSLQPELQRLPSLINLDLSYNQLEGVIPETWTSLKFRLLRLNGNPGIGSPVNALPKFLRQDKTSRVKQTLTQVFGCPGIRSIGNSLAAISIDPSYYGYDNCSCDSAYHGDYGVCVACLPDHMTCDGSTLPIIHKGYYPLPNATRPVAIVQCLPIGFNETSCNPAQSRPFECATGYFGRLCSECISPGYFREGVSCSACPTTLGTVALPLAIIKVAILCAVAIAFPIYIIHLPFQPRKQIGGKLSSLIGFLQLLSGISGLPLPWPPELRATVTVTELLNFSIGEGMECGQTLLGHRYWFLVYNFLGLALPLFGLLYVLIAHGITLLSYKIRGRTFDRKPGLRTRSIYMLVYVLELSYFPVVNRVLRALSCEPDSVSGVMYNSQVPWLSCDTTVNPSYGTLYGIAMAVFVLFVVGIPVLFTMLLARSWAYLASRELWGLIYDEFPLDETKPTVLKGSLAWFGSFFGPYRRSCFGWSMVVLLRKLLLSFALAFIPSTSAWSGIIVGAVLLASFLLQVTAHPYRSKLSNKVETTLVLILVWTFISGQLLSNSFVTTSMSWISVSVVGCLVWAFLIEIHAFLCDFAAYTRAWDRCWAPFESIDLKPFVYSIFAPRHRGDDIALDSVGTTTAI